MIEKSFSRKQAISWLDICMHLVCLNRNEKVIASVMMHLACRLETGF